MLALDSNFNVVGKTGDIIEPENVVLYDLQNGDYLDENHIFNLSEEEIKEKLKDIKKEYDPENKIPPFKANVTFSKGIGGSDGYRPKGDYITWTKYMVTNKFKELPVVGRTENEELRKNINDFVDELYSKTNKNLVTYILGGSWPSILEEPLEKYINDRILEEEQNHNRDIR